jgi:hypothetical protein
MRRSIPPATLRRSCGICEPATGVIKTLLSPLTAIVLPKELRFDEERKEVRVRRDGNHLGAT